MDHYSESSDVCQTRTNSYCNSSENYRKGRKVRLEQSSFPASVNQLDAHLTGDQEVGVQPHLGGNVLSWRSLIMKYFLWTFSPFR